MMNTALARALLLTLSIALATAIPFRPRHHYGAKNQLQDVARKSKKFHTSMSGSTNDVLTTLRGGGEFTELELADAAFEWCANLGAPAALVGGAVLATLSETREAMAPKRTDSFHIRLFKQLQRFLLVSAFAFEIVSIFSTTVTGTMLLSEGDRPSGTGVGKAYVSPMGFMHHNHAFEYLTARVMFLQGLFNWLLGTALELAIPKPGEGESSRLMNNFISGSLVTMIFMMLSFYNKHMTFYDNYFGMLKHYAKESIQRYFTSWPPRPMAFLYTPALIWTIRTGYLAFTCNPKLDEDEQD